jgi:LuxR family transcriptional regulator, maltose regulon positive regulatory protein
MVLLLPTKFYIPPAPAGYIPRPHLFEKLDKALTRRLSLVSAPAGTGKTTLVTAWAQLQRNQGKSIGWLSLDTSENSPLRFLEYFIACLEDGGILLDSGTISSTPRKQIQVQDLLNYINKGLTGLKREVIIILDDYHLIQNIEVHTALKYILEHAPTCLHIILLTRSDPPLELARRRMAGELLELRMEQLRFSIQETDVYFRHSAGLFLAESEIIALNERTEGWIAGLQLAAISLRDHEDTSTFIAAFTGSHRYVFDYLLEQVLDQQDHEVREFLLKTSLLERFSVPLCDAVVGIPNVGRRMLHFLEQANLFLIPLDDERIWFRYHHLFADLLRLMFEQAYPDLATDLHVRACSWYEEHHKIPEAFQHALAAGDMALAARLVSTNVLLLVEQSELYQILSRISAIPRKQIQSIPWMAVAHAWALAYNGQLEHATASLKLAEKNLNTLSDNDQTRIMGHITAVQAYIAWVQGNQNAAIELAETAACLLPAEEIALRALNLTTLGNSLSQFGPNLRATEVLEGAVTLARQVDQLHVFMMAASALAYAYKQLGRLTKAHTICQDAIEISESHQKSTGQPLPQAAPVYSEFSSILHEWGETELAIQAARKGVALSELWGQADSIVLCLLNLINGLSFVQDEKITQKAIYRARTIAQRVSPWFVANVDQIEVRFWLDMDDIPQATRAFRDAIKPLPPSVEASLLLKQKQVDEAIQLIRHALSQTMPETSRESIRLSITHSMAFYMKNDPQQALSILKKTLELAEPENWIATFVRQGEPMENLLRMAQRKSISSGYIRRLLVAFEAQRKTKPVSVTEALIEPLSDREREILHLLNGPLSTPEIAGQLIVSSNTVRTHIKNIYGKLGVHGRSAAVRRGRELGLLV